MRLKNIFLLLLLILTAASCGKKPHAEHSQILRLNLADDPTSLDPRVVRNLRDLTLVKQLFEGLMRIDTQGIPQPALAERVDVSEDLLTYTFHLRDSSWNNHDPVTAYDFEYAWKTVLTPSFASDYAYMLYPIKNAQSVREGKSESHTLGVLALNDKTLQVQLQSPTPYFLELVAFPTYFPINHSIATQEKNWAQPPGERFVCNGPFCLKKWSPQINILLEKNSSYWEADQVHLEGIAFSVISDNNTESQLFEKDELDWLGQPISHNISAETFHHLKEKGGISSYPVAGTFWFKFNVTQPPFDNANIRKAFSYAINRNAIIEHVLQGNQALATGPLPPCMRLEGRPYFADGDSAAAQHLLSIGLSEQGWTADTFPKVILNYPPTERNTKIVQLVQQQWRAALGIEVELGAVENQLYRRNVRQGLYQVGTGDWFADFNDPLAFLELFKYRNDGQKGSGMNDTGWQNERYISLLDQSLQESQLDKRRALLEEAEQILVDEMPIAPVYHCAFDYVKKPYVHDVVLSPLGLADFKTTSLSR